MINATISVIVPIYNAEPYLKRCLDSIVAQTFASLEIILVDDGSTDRSGDICECYARADTRIRVIHQDNQGVSAARNAGLRAASGDWIGWVDSDDWIETDMFAFLLSQAQMNNTDISVCGRFEEYPRRTARFGRTEQTVLDQEQALLTLLREQGVDNALYDKLWKRHLFQDLSFPVGQTYEDLTLVWQLFARAERVCFSPEQKYHYRLRTGSITDTPSLHNRMNHYRAARDRYEQMQLLWPQFLPDLEERCVTSAVGIWSSWYHNSRSTRNAYQAQVIKIAQYVKPRIQSVLRRTNYGLAGRLILRLLPYARPWSFLLAGYIGRLYQLKNGRTL